MAPPEPTSDLPAPFELLGPLPEGTTVLEASAGTGKTFTIAGLVTRYVAEGVAEMEQLLVVSFSRESTRELRERVRSRLVTARDGLADPADAHPDDFLLAHLAADRAEIPVRLRRLEDALASFDSATVTTTHGFCQQVLQTLGTAGDSDPGAVLLENVDDLVREVADDLYLRKWGFPGATTDDRIPRKEFGRLALDVAKDPATRLLPDPATTSGGPAMRARIAGAVRTEIDRRKRRQNAISYDDMLLRVAATLADPHSGPAAKARLRGRYQIVLVDEFQDTDPVQWSILYDAFHGHRTLVLIGDPKQAIYAFRGADVHAYLAAATAARSVSTLPVNWRSDAALLDGLAAVFRVAPGGGAALGDPRIRVVPVQAAHTGPMVEIPNVDTPVRLRVLNRADIELNRDGTGKTAEAKSAIARDLAAEVVALLSGAQLRPRTRQQSGDRRPLAPGDIAVLVRTNKQAELVRVELQRAAVPVVVTGRTSVFATEAAEEWQVLLEALEQPHRTARVRRLALGCFVGSTATELDERGDAFADDLALRVRGWGQVLTERGVAALFETVSMPTSLPGSMPANREPGLQERLLSRPGGERLLTDLRHLAESLHHEALEEHLGLTALLGWLRRRREEAKIGGGQERSRRLESDAEAVQVITIHTSKGLEFPVVMVPFAWDGWKRDDPSSAVFHDEADQRVRDVGGPGSPDWDAHVAKHKQADIDDELRLTYVALTRAQSSLVLWWAGTYNTPQSPLHRLLLHDDLAVPAPLSIGVPSDSAAVDAFRALAAGSSGGLGVEIVAPRPQALWSPPAPDPALLSAARFNRGLDLDWRRTSYSALTAAAHDAAPSGQVGAFGSEPETEQTEDEADLDEGGIAADVPTPDAAPSLWDALPSGAAFGTLVHSMLEDLADPTDDAKLADLVAAQTMRFGSDADPALLTDALAAALATPLGPLAGGAALRDLTAADRLPELDFELPLAGGDEPDAVQAGQVMLGDLVPLWRAHVPDGLLASYAEHLADLAPSPLRGYLTGSIDAVLRVRRPDGHPTYLVVDYKTNRLGERGEPLTGWHYRPDALEDAMIDAHYPLQALLYAVALHRYLRWRQPGYDPEVHLGGALYLFLRGMGGTGTDLADGSVPGVFSWRIPAALVTETSDLLAGASAAAGRSRA